MKNTILAASLLASFSSAAAAPLTYDFTVSYARTSHWETDATIRDDETFSGFITMDVALAENKWLSAQDSTYYTATGCRHANVDGTCYVNTGGGTPFITELSVTTAGGTYRVVPDLNRAVTNELQLDASRTLIYASSTVMTSLPDAMFEWKNTIAGLSFLADGPVYRSADISRLAQLDVGTLSQARFSLIDFRDIDTVDGKHQSSALPGALDSFPLRIEGLVTSFRQRIAPEPEPGPGEVPEPSTIGLLFAGAAGLLLRRRSRAAQGN